jgi:hypothetical protein
MQRSVSILQAAETGIDTIQYLALLQGCNFVHHASALPTDVIPEFSDNAFNIAILKARKLSGESRHTQKRLQL